MRRVILLLLCVGCRQPAEPRNLCDTANMTLTPKHDSLRVTKLPTATIIVCKP